VPGVLAQINERFSRSGVNIAAQYLQTDADLGYVVIDIDGDANQVSFESLCDIPGTIRCRVLY
jgi:D-3-phosphoglycerate dehydrogenase / 2-oxoglutarate reductase